MNDPASKSKINWAAVGLAVRRWLLVILALYIAVMLTIVAVRVAENANRNNNQDSEISALVHEQGKLIAANERQTRLNEDSAYRGCLTGNERAGESNKRRPGEEVELNTALAVGILLQRFHIEVPGVTVDPSEVEVLRDELSDVPERACGKEYPAAARRAQGDE